MKIIEKTSEKESDIDSLYKSDSVIFEETTLVSDKLNYVISYFPKDNVYDVIIENKNSNMIIYQSFPKLSSSTLKYFNLLKDETYNDNFGNSFKCISHTIEYNL
ncbi:MAG: hypothetical protein BZ134_07030 [Methanosphaera sp. SHI1033]|nr:MAG: hypothetical protein BZ134_07030 [Methanosphaera sp. SHI1033]